MNQSAESNDSITSLRKNTQEHIKNTIAFRENISNLYNALGREEIWAAKRCQMGCLKPEPSTYIYTTRAALNK